jgi:hypothetical protein
MSSTNSSNLTFGGNQLLIESAVFTPELLDLFLLALGIGGMHQGIEIGHPVYSLLFANLVFPFLVTIINISFFFFISLQGWLRLAPSLNYLCLMFHSTTW